MQKNIGQILCQEISPKYKKYNKNTNKNVYENVINVPIIKKLLSENYSKFIKDIYCKYEKKINLSKYGLKENLIINCKIKMYIDLINEYKYDNRYCQQLKECFQNWFLNEK